MADTHDLIQTTTLSTTSNSIVFNSIPSTYDILKIVIHARSDASGNTGTIDMLWNGTSYTTSGKYLFWNMNSGGDLNPGNAALNLFAAWIPNGSIAANSFGSAEVYIADYHRSTPKIYMSDTWHGTKQSFSTNQAYMGLFRVRNTTSVGISSITFYPGTNPLSVGTTISMYGIKGA